MEPELFEHILQEVLPFSKHIYLHVQGEPLLHPSFNTILHICEQQHACIHLVTNGSRIDRHFDILSSSCIQSVAVSLQSAAARNPETIEEYMNRIIFFSQYASANTSVPVDLRLWRSETETDPNMRLCLAKIRESYTLVPTKRRNSYMIMPHVYVSFENDFQWPDDTDAGSDCGTCLGGRMQMAVLSSGAVVPCCLDAEGVIELGNLKEESFSDILKKPRYQALIHGFQTHHLSEPLCRSCSFRRRFD